MPLSPEELGRLAAEMARGSTASAARPFLQVLARDHRWADIPEAITAAVGMMEINREMGARFLANSVPAVVLGALLRGDDGDPSRIAELTVEDKAWGDRLRAFAFAGDGMSLEAAVEELLDKARAKAS
jgi:hypothetical protein